MHLLNQLFKNGTLKSFQELREQYAIPNMSFFRCLQIRHALGEQSRERALEWSKIPLLQKAINAKTLKGLISGLYPHIYI